jgi:peptidoglycan/LPS O-acetylase OafA/YrhL
MATAAPAPPRTEDADPAERTAQPAAPRARLAGIDGLRAIAALWVVLFHIRAFSGARLGAVPGLDLLVRSGSAGVSLFLVLSGFCLSIPFAAGRQRRFAARRFLVRRCWRLLPAYYASLLVIVVVTAVWGGGLGLEQYTGAGLAAQVAAHATMTHTFFPATFYALNGAYWSLGLEWQLYLLLPLMVLAARRWGVRRVVVAAIGINVAYRIALALLGWRGVVPQGGLLETAVLPNLAPGRCAEFALGLVAAELYAGGGIGVWAARLRPAPLLLVPLGLLAVGDPLSHLVFGALFFVLVATVLAQDNVVARLAGWRPLAALGAMSYSLYLVHQPMVQAGAHLLRAAGLGRSGSFVALFCMLPAVILAARLLFVAVERRTLQQPGGGRAATREAGRSSLRRALRLA